MPWTLRKQFGRRLPVNFIKKLTFFSSNSQTCYKKKHSSQKKYVRIKASFAHEACSPVNPPEFFSHSLKVFLPHSEEIKKTHFSSKIYQMLKGWLWTSEIQFWRASRKFFYQNPGKCNFSIFSKNNVFLKLLPSTRKIQFWRTVEKFSSKVQNFLPMNQKKCKTVISCRKLSPLHFTWTRRMQFW